MDAHLRLIVDDSIVWMFLDSPTDLLVAMRQLAVEVAKNPNGHFEIQRVSEKGRYKTIAVYDPDDVYDV